MRRLKKEYVEELLSYNRDKGVFIWLVSRGSVKPGRFAGTINLGRGRPYYQIKIDRRFYYSHKLAWLLEYNEWPDSLDHINGDSLDNRIANLRKCDMSQNKANSRKYKNNKSGAKGVFKEGARYSVSIGHKKKRIHVGTYYTFNEAKSAYTKAAQKLFGEFARAE